MGNPLLELKAQGQSVWLDYIRRDLITSGELQRLIDGDGVAGVTSNPSIFEKAITSSADYDPVIKRTAGQPATAIFDALAIDDVRAACDVFAPVYVQTGGGDGYVSLEVPASLAYDTTGTISAARRFWEAVARPNVMIKIPATAAGVPAIEESLAAGININITLIFSLERYKQVAEAHQRALERRVEQGQPVDRLASVASFFVSRVDSLIDKQLTDKAQTADADTAKRLRALQGKIAIANSRLAYWHFQQLTQGERFRALAVRGACPQRLLWASTSTKNPQYPDTYYVDELIGPQTVNTIPPDTLKLFREHGRVRASLAEDVSGAQAAIDSLAALGIDLAAATDQLEHEGVKLFDDAYNKLLRAIEVKAGGRQ
ncbi:MAG: transaldolase [Chloroflexi bacterium]|nr:transaldolase [Chloroflexota bacterium]